MGERREAPALNCARCGFKSGDRVTMKSGWQPIAGSRTTAAPPLLHGVVEDWHAGCGHIIVWKETGGATALPNANVERDSGE